MRRMLTITLLLLSAAPLSGQRLVMTEKDALSGLQSRDTDIRFKALAYAERPSDTDWSGSVSSGLQALRFMVQDGTISVEMRPRVAAVAEAWLTGGPHDHGLVRTSMDIAIALGDAGLVSLVERLTDPDAVAITIGPDTHQRLAGHHRGTCCQPVVGWRLLGIPPAMSS